MCPTIFTKYIRQCRSATFFLYYLQLQLHINQNFGMEVLNTNTNYDNILSLVILRQEYPLVMKYEIYVLGRFHPVTGHERP